MSTDKPSYKDLAKEVIAEAQHSEDLFGEFQSLHEGYAITKEEMEELWDEVKRCVTPDDKEIGNAMIEVEAKQLTAMGLKMLKYIRQHRK